MIQTWREFSNVFVVATVDDREVPESRQWINDVFSLVNCVGSVGILEEKPENVGGDSHRINTHQSMAHIGSL